MTWRRSALLLLGLSFAILGLVQLDHSRDAGARALRPICRVETADRVVALTFDDGPDPTYTSTILRELRIHGAKATFFLTGVHAAAHPSLVRDESKAGMEIGNHTWSHMRLTEAALETVRSEIGRTSDTIDEATGAKPRLGPSPLWRCDDRGARGGGSDGDDRGGLDDRSRSLPRRAGTRPEISGPTSRR